MTDRTRSHLLKAQELEASIDPTGLWSLQITQSQDAAEHAFRAILFGMGINRLSDHRLDIVARQHQQLLTGVWPCLEPLLPDYAWLWEWRNVARYAHVDAPPEATPEITEHDLNRARQTTKKLVEIAQSLV
ncbi:MAG: HEPN domain-containing protein [Acidobacteriota bacterium]|nr:HEPN domain-containing protein [Acidobacteriota bacterium]